MLVCAPWARVLQLVLFAIVILSGNSFLHSQNIDLYLSLIEEGKVAEVRSNLPALELKYPNDPGVKYLKALVHINGEESVELYRNLLKDYPNSRYADDATMKIGEYLYTRGLYSQASKHFRSIPIKYNDTNLLERSIQLMVNSYIATGEEDSAKYYLRRFGEQYPNLNIHNFGVSEIGESLDRPALVQVDKATATKKIAHAKETRQKPQIKIPPATQTPRPWVVQVGAFGNYTNAKNLKMKLGEAGYSVRMDEVSSGSRRLHVVRVVRYTTRDEALTVGRELNKRFGLDFRVLNKPE